MSAFLSINKGILLDVFVSSDQQFTDKVFLQLQNNHLFALRNLRLYYTFSYFSFFFDCFLGFIMCLSRISKGTLCTFIFFA